VPVRTRIDQSRRWRTSAWQKENRWQAVAEGHDTANKVVTVEDSAASGMHEQDISACTQPGQWVRQWYMHLFVCRSESRQSCSDAHASHQLSQQPRPCLNDEASLDRLLRLIALHGRIWVAGSHKRIDGRGRDDDVTCE
jgi:hypothetical protein